MKPLAGLALAAVALVASSILAFSVEQGGRDGGTLKRPIRPAQQTAVAFGERSHWLQPWRGYLDTPPATRLREAIGINFNVEPDEALSTARLLSASGFTRARVEVSWDSLSYSNPTRLRDPDRLQRILGALRRHGIRPLILLNANHNGPGPNEALSVQLSQPAAKGARQVRMEPRTARRIRPGRSGLNRKDGKLADVIFTSVRPDGSATLSKPLPGALAAGDHEGATLLHEPFGPPRLTKGRPNPRFERTLRGWLDYTTTIVRNARAILGDDAFDVEIWNEQTFGSDFLFQDRYYDPPREQGDGDVTREILERTVAELRGESQSIGIGDGFASQTPFPSGTTSPPGLTAIDKHPYYGAKRFPAHRNPKAIKPVDARGRRSTDEFVPSYTAFFPEYILTAIQTETMVRDISPITTDVNGTPHGRRTHPPGGPPPQLWITEANLDPTGADPSNPDDPEGEPVALLTPGDVQHLQAKAALRYYTAFVNKGVSAVHLFAVKGGNLALVDPRDPAGGETPRAIRRLAQALRRARPLERTQPLSLLEVSDEHGHTQFEGNGSKRYPPLYDRDVVAFLPFQLSRGRYLAAVYVMTRNLATLYEPDAPESDRSRYDMPPASFELVIGGLGREDIEVRATDPLLGTSEPVEVIARKRGRIRVKMPLTDSPRLLSLTQR